ncbi:hypothetical protein CBS101457_000490 [Exobasidium rhododendri]|nr:hypothetical protein CBS101457_000490 [Exobasidium rhododendri]
MANSPLSRYLRQQPDFNEPSSSSSPLPALYSDLAAHKSSNRASFEASVDWWARLLFKAALVGAQSGSSGSSSRNSSAAISPGKGKQVESNVISDRLVLHLDQRLVEECTIEEVGRPLSLGTVIIELQASHHLYAVNAFLSSASKLTGPSTSKKRLSSTVFSVASFPLTWAFSQLSSSLGLGEGVDGEDSERDWKKARGDWVIWDNLQSITNAILSIHRSSPRLSPLESLFSLRNFQVELVDPAFKQIAGDSAAECSTAPCCSSLDLRVLIRYMERDRGVAISQGQVIKLEHNEGEALHGITEEEKGIVNVKETYTRLVSQVDEIEKRIQERQARVERALREKKREQAMSYLRSRKMLDELLEKRTKSMETLHGVLIKIEQAASDVEIITAYDMSTSALKALLSNEKLQPEHIENSMDQMQDTLADADEVRRAVEAGNEGLQRAADGEELDDEELEAELKRLKDENDQEQEEEEEERKRVIKEATSKDLQAMKTLESIKKPEATLEKHKKESQAEAFPA